MCNPVKDWMTPKQVTKYLKITNNMPTTEEIKKIARRFELDMYPTMPDMLSAKAMLEWLSKDYCIVPKELIRKEYEKAQKTHDIYTSATCINEMESRAIDHAEGRMCELTTLFGKSLFEEEKL